jgi:tetratricopeptide (TPR) repeat protein
MEAQVFERYQAPKDSIIPSKHLGFSKEISVVLPKEYQIGIRNQFPIIIIFDKQNQRSYNYILKTIDYLTSTEQIPASIVIGIGSDMEHRYIETQYSINDDLGIANKTELFILDEVIGEFSKKYNCLNYSLLIGHSRYGFLTTSMLAKFTDKIDAVISLSPFFEERSINLVDTLKRYYHQPAAHKRYYRFAIGNDYPDDFQLMTKMLEGEKPSLSMDAHSALFAEADHNAIPGLYIAQSLYEIFEFWSQQQTEFIRNPKIVKDDVTHRMNQVENNYGVKIPFSLGTLNGRAWYYYGENKFDEAIESWDLTLIYYPNFSEANLYIASTLKEINRPYKKYIEEFNHSIIKNNFYSTSEKQELIKEYEELINH